MATAKVALETDLLQWSSDDVSVSKLEEWIQDRESKLNQAMEHRSVMITRRSTLGINAVSTPERYVQNSITNGF